MIPRPQDDEGVHKEEAEVGERVLKLFQDRIESIKDAEGLSEYEHKQLLKLGVRANSVPMSFGYEVTPVFEQDRNPSTSKDNISRQGSLLSNKSVSSIDKPKIANLASSLRVSVKLTSDKNEFVENRESRGVVLESDGKSTYCISEDGGHEEGMEVIGLGRYSSMNETTEEIEEDLLGNASSESLDVDDRLRQALSASERIGVAYYKPEAKAGPVGDSKLKEE